MPPTMRLSRVYLRWYKSFNIDYTGTAGGDRVATKRPWNAWILNSAKVELPFVEIPIEPDITTIVGANESGKSQLLSAISSVLRGKSIPADPFSSSTPEGRDFSQTDLCHFALPLTKEATLWPQLGLEFSALTREEFKELTDVEPPKGDSSLAVQVFLMHGENGTVASVYHAHADEPHSLSESELASVRQLFPQMHFINSQLPFADEIQVADLLRAYGEKPDDPEPFYDSLTVQKVAREFVEMPLPTGKEQPFPPETLKQIQQWQSDIRSSAARRSQQLQLEVKLFRDVLEIPKDTVKRLFELREEDSSHAAAMVSEWNAELERVLNLSRYWQQDQDFAIKLRYHQRTISFEITDKTQKRYTFRERSSGLRYFLSYYIQAKAIEKASTDKSHVVLMDEPDSFLSIAGQRNLLAVFESLVRRRGNHQLQLVYTTHSPFLIHRNFPKRIRLVRKGDAEEGTQLVDKARARRFEPIRSALGIDLSQTLFMGAVNIITEGPTDQYFIAEAIRLFAPEAPASDLINLNEVVVVSGESASQIYKVIESSKWADELVPTAIVILDHDAEGKRQRDRLIGSERDTKAVVNEESILFVNRFVDGADEGRDVTTEDLVPTSLFVRAVWRYLNRWLKEEAKALGDLESIVTIDDFKNKGHVAAARAVFDKVRGTTGNEYDKLGVFEELFAELHTQTDAKKNDEGAFAADRKLLKERVINICRVLRSKIEAGTRTERQRTGVQAVARLVGDFFMQHQTYPPPTLDLEMKLDRLSAEARLFGAEEGSSLLGVLSTLTGRVRAMRQTGRTDLSKEDWDVWRGDLEAIRRNPLNPMLPSLAAAAPAPTTAPPAAAPSQEPKKAKA